MISIHCCMLFFLVNPLQIFGISQAVARFLAPNLSGSVSSSWHILHHTGTKRGPQGFENCAPENMVFESTSGTKPGTARMALLHYEIYLFERGSVRLSVSFGPIKPRHRPETLGCPYPAPSRAAPHGAKQDEDVAPDGFRGSFAHLGCKVVPSGSGQCGLIRSVRSVQCEWIVQDHSTVHILYRVLSDFCRNEMQAIFRNASYVGTHSKQTRQMEQHHQRCAKRVVSEHMWTDPFPRFSFRVRIL